MEKHHFKLIFENEIIRIGINKDMSYFQFKQFISYYKKEIIEKIYFLDDENEYILIENEKEWNYFNLLSQKIKKMKSK
jgi:hypothetical protein